MKKKERTTAAVGSLWAGAGGAQRVTVALQVRGEPREGRDTCTHHAPATILSLLHVLTNHILPRVPEAVVLLFLLSR